MNSLLKKKKFIITLLVSGGIFIFLSSFAIAADDLGKNYRFFIDPIYDISNRTETLATLRKISNNAYFYIEDSYWLAIPTDQQNTFLSNVDKLAGQFDGTIYPSLTRVFGQEWKPGIDGDNRIIILLTQLKTNTGGYFNERDELSQLTDPQSNQREMIYLNAAQINNSLIYSLLAHEFQHLINWNQKDRLRGVKEDIWLNELKSEYAPTIAGYDDIYVGSNLERRVDDFLANPFNSLTEWKGERYDYPSVNLFGHYLTGQLGTDIFSYMMQGADMGIKSIENILSIKNSNLNFSQIFNNWVIADYINDISIDNGQYGYKNPSLMEAVHVSPISYSIVSTNVINIFQNIKDWAPYWYRFVNKQDSSTLAKDLEVEFEGGIQTGNFSVIYIIDYIGQPDPIIGLMTLNNQKGILQVPDFRDDVNSITIVVSNQYKRTNFTASDPITPFTLSIATTIFQEPVNPPGEPGTGIAKPSDYGLKEGDLIRAEGDLDVYIISQYGYKRLFLNPVIFNMYGHLGGWAAIKTVKPQVRDAFITSNLYRYSDSPKVYELELTGADTGKLHWLNMTGEAFLSQNGKPESVFIINKSEYNWYPKSTDKISL